MLKQLRRALILGGCVVAWGWGTDAAMAQAHPRTTLTGQRPEVVPSLQPLGRLDGAKQLELSINLPWHNQQALSNLLEQIYDPASPSYRHYLAPDEFAARFGPTEEDYQALISWATANGFTIAGRHPNRMLLEVSAPVANIERALQVTMRTYAHPTESRTFFAPDGEPSADTGVPILNIGGLDNFARPHPTNLRHTPMKVAAKATPQDIGSGPNGNLAGFDYRAAYVPGVSLTGKGQIVGLVEFDGYHAGDITEYQTLTGMPYVPLQVVLVDDFDGIPTEGTNSGNSEVALDIEMSISMAPGLSSVVVYEAGPEGFANDILDLMATNTAIKQFSCSWGFGPVTVAQRAAMDNYFMEFGAQGQTFFDASGDVGAATNNLPVSPPADDPYITQVGGTSLATAGAGAPWLSEIVWNAQEGPGFNVSSGGVSTVYNIPSWQKGINMTASKGSTTKRNFPDVAMVADNIFLVADDGQEETSGGTSAASPLWAAFTALANQQADLAGLPPIGFLNPALYHIATNSGYTACLNDITVGNNTNNNSQHYFAVPGYDLCTGLGSPAGGSLIFALVQPDGFQITPGRGAVANGLVGGPFTVTNQTLTLTNSGTAAFNWALSSSSAWLDVSNSSGTLVPGGGAASVTLNLNSAASLLPSGVYTDQLWFTNLTSGLAQLRQFTLQVGQELVQDGGFESGDLAYWTLSGPSISIYTNNFADNGDLTGYSPYEGDWFAVLGQITGLAYLSQTLPTEQGQFYRVSFWLQNPFGITQNSYNPNQFLARWISSASYTNVLFNQTNMGAFGWNNYQFTVQAFSNLTTLQFGNRNPNDFFCLDSVSVMAVPPPSFPLTAGGLQVTINPPGAIIGGAQWEVDGGPAQNSGVTLSNLTAGTHTVMFLPVSGWNPPVAQSVVMTDGIITSTSGLYTQVKGDPVVVISSPKSGQSVSNGLFLVTGVAADKVTVDEVFYRLNGSSWTLASPSNSWANWSAIVTLNPGPNTISAYALDNSGTYSATNTVAFKFIPSAMLAVATNGFGGITPVDNGHLLAVGTNYTLTATPGKNWLFSNWVGGTSLPYSVLSTEAAFKFPMQSNLVVQANFVTNLFLAAQGTYHGLFAPAALTRTQTNSGYFTFTVTSTGVLSGDLFIGSEAIPLPATKLDVGGAATIHSTVHGTAFTTTLQLGLVGQSVGGTVTNDSLVAVLDGDQAVFSTAHPASNYDGLYTLIIPGTNDPAIGPFGTSYGTVTVAPAGTITFAGYLADGTLVSQGTSVSADGRWPLYLIPASNTNESVFGWAYLTNRTITAPNFVSWISVTNKSKTAAYAGGFTNQQASIEASVYTATNKPLLDLTNAQVILDEASWPMAITNEISWATNNLIKTNTNPANTNKLVLTITPAGAKSGLLTGSFQNPANPKQTITVNGVLLQNQTNAQGYFLGTNQTGAFLLHNP